MPPNQAADHVGAATLERMAAAPRYNQWMYERLRPWVGRRVLEIGAGIGNMSAFLIDRDRVVLTDTEPYYLDRLDRKSTRLNSSHLVISYAVFCLKKKKTLAN